MMAADRTVRLNEIGAVLAERMPAILDAAIALLESIAPLPVDVARHPRYEIEDKLGEGGQAEVLLGTVHGAEGFHRLVAIKRVRVDRGAAGGSVANLLEEAYLAAPLSHPNVVSVLDVDRDEAGQPFLVMEYVDGVSLEKLIETGPLPHPVAIFIVHELLAGLAYIHQFRGRGGVRGLVHRDVSPHNVLLSWQGEVKLADFGIAQMLDGGMTAGAVVPVGKAGYMSPEQAYRMALDGRSDLYAVGIVLWELLAHERLRVGPAGAPQTRIIFQAIPRPSEYRAGVPADLEAIAMRLLAHLRGARYQTAELAAQDLVRCQDASRDGRGELVRFLAERFPRSRRRGPSSRPPTPSHASKGPITVEDAAVTTGAPPKLDPGPEPGDPGSDQGRAGALGRAGRRRPWGLAFGALFALLLAAAIALLAVR